MQSLQRIQLWQIGGWVEHSSAKADLSVCKAWPKLLFEILSVRIPPGCDVQGAVAPRIVPRIVFELNAQDTVDVIQSPGKVARKIVRECSKQKLDGVVRSMTPALSVFLSSHTHSRELIRDTGLRKTLSQHCLTSLCCTVILEA